MTRTSRFHILSPVLVVLTLVACDSSGSEPAADETGGELASAEASPTSAVSAQQAAHAEHHGKRMRHRAMKRVERLCEVVACDAEQRGALEALVEREGGEAEGAAEAHVQIKAARAQLAAAFRGGDFDGADVEAFFSVLEAVRPVPAKELSARMAEAHALLSPEQRELLAQRIEAGEFRPERGQRGRHEAGGKAKQGKEGSAKREGHRAKRMIERVCGHLECTSEQRSAMSQLAQRHHEARKAQHVARDSAGREPMQAQLASMIRSEALDAEVVRAHMEAAHAEREGHRIASKGQMAELALDLHALLTPVQRTKVAERIELGPMGPFFGPGGKHRRGHHGSRD